MKQPYTFLPLSILFLLVIGPAVSQIDSIQFDKYPAGQLGFTGNYFTEIVEDKDGFIWIGGQPGLFRFDGYQFQAFHELADNGHIRFLFADSKGQIWVSTYGGLSVFDPVKRTTHSYFFKEGDSRGLSHQLAEPILEDTDGTMWIGTVNGLNKLDTKTQTFQIYYCKNGASGLENFVVRMIQDRSNPDLIWIASNRGLQKFSKSTGIFEIFPAPFSWPNYNSKSGLYPVLGIHQDPQGIIWVGLSASNDLLKYNPANNEWKQYAFESREQFGFRRDIGMYAIMDKSEDELWIASLGGTGVFDKKNETFDFFDLDDDKDGSALASVSRTMLIDRRGYLWLPSLKGISRSRKPVVAAQSNVKPRKVFLANFRLSGRSLPPNDIHNPLDSFSLGRSDNSFAVDFCIPVPRIKEDVVYATRLIGKEKSWREQGNLITREFRELNGGHYTLEIKAKEGDGEWGETLRVPIIVEEGWWETVWFKLAFLLFLAGLISAYFLIRKQHQKRENRIREDYQNQLAQVQMEALRAQMNPHFLFNTLNSINHYILKNDSAEASAYLTKFSRLMRQVLLNSKSQTVKLLDELDALKLYIDIERLRFKDEFEYLINIDPTINQDEISIPPMLIQPYVENAIWHGLMHKEGDRKLEVSVSVDQQYLIISVKDNGIGRKASEKFKSSLGTKKSFGMQITKDRVALVNKLFKTNTEIEILDQLDNDGQVSGTEVLVTIPLIGTRLSEIMHVRN